MLLTNWSPCEENMDNWSQRRAINFKLYPKRFLLVTKTMTLETEFIEEKKLKNIKQNLGEVKNTFAILYSPFISSSRGLWIFDAILNLRDTRNHREFMCFFFHLEKATLFFSLLMLFWIRKKQQSSLMTFTSFFVAKNKMFWGFSYNVINVGEPLIGL